MGAIVSGFFPISSFFALICCIAIVLSLPKNLNDTNETVVINRHFTKPKYFLHL